MTRVVRWKEGDTSLWKAVDDWLVGAEPGLAVADNERRSIVRLRTDSDVEVVAKHFRPRSSLQRWIGAVRRRFALSSAWREWRALRRMRAVGLNVPEPLAMAQLQDGGELLILSFVAGRPLQDALTCTAPARRRLLVAVANQVALLHSSGWVHRDLHLGNFLVDPSGEPVLLDFQRAKKTHAASARIRDLGDLDFSLARAHHSIADRMRLRSAALGVSGRSSPAERSTLRRVGDACEERANRHFTSRTRRCLRPGRLYAELHLEGRTGLRVRSVPAEVIAELLAIHRSVHSDEGERDEGELATRGTALKHDHRAHVTAAEVAGRAFVIKQVVKRGRARLLADAVRGSPARRAWLGGHGLLARGIRAATPIAFVEARHLGIPVSSVVVLEDVRPAMAANEWNDSTPGAGRDLADSLRRLTVTLHRRGVVHSDLQAPHIYLFKQAERLESALIDLEGVRFRRRLSDDERIQSLAELNASLPDKLLCPAERRRAFELYAQALPFGSGDTAQRRRGNAEREIVRRSIARGHLWAGDGCRPRE